jgi:hypothetical protein
VRNAISAFTRVFDALWWRRALLNRGVRIAHILPGFVDPALRSSVKNAALRPGHGARDPCATHTHAIVSGKLPWAAPFLKSVVFKSFTLF